MIKRIIGVFLLRKQVFEEIGQDPSATWQAALIVSIVALFAAISATIRAAVFGLGFGALNMSLDALEGLAGDIAFRLPVLNGPIPAFLSTFTGAFVSWLVWALVTWLIGEYLFKGDAGFAEMARIIGYAKAPQILSALGFIPAFGLLFRFAGWVWMLVATFVGIKQGLELSTGKTILTIVVSGLVVFLIQQFVIDPIFIALF